MAQINKIESSEAKPMPENLKFKKEKDRTPVRGKFIFHEVPGGRMDFVYRAYKGDPIEKYSMADGEICTIPLGVAKHLNTNCWYPGHEYKDDEAGRSVCKMTSKIRRCSFQSLEFIDVEGVAPVGSPATGIEKI
jgi:hypothetical protein